LKKWTEFFLDMYKKFFRYIFLYGLLRTLSKSLYRLDGKIPILVLRVLYSIGKDRSERIGIIGLGNQGFTSIAFFLCLSAKRRISFVVDPSYKAKIISRKVLKCEYFPSMIEAKKAEKFYGDILYIASDHNTHAEYAFDASNVFRRIYVEKPLFVNKNQALLFKRIIQRNVELYSGFNRPHTVHFQSMLSNIGKTFSVSMIINGHFLAKDHWYRDSNQGTRVQGNLTHWIDLSLRLLFAKKDKLNIHISLIAGHLDDMCVSLSEGDRLINLLFSANCEPRNGVEEFIHWNSDESIGSIKNFKEIEILTKDGKYDFKKSIRKEVGHREASLAPLQDSPQPDFIEYLSSKLSFSIADMYSKKIEKKNFRLIKK